MTSDKPAQSVSADDLLYSRVQVPDLGAQEEFLTELGMVQVSRTTTTLHMRGSHTTPFIYATSVGEPRVLGIAFGCKSEDDLHRLAERPDASAVHTADEPGAGRRVVLTDPNGYGIEVVHGMRSSDSLKVETVPVNTGLDPVARRGRGPWQSDRSPTVLRLGHAVLKTEMFDISLDWYCATLGLVRSDEIVDAQGDLVGAFNRVNLGKRYSDHHALLVSRGAPTGWRHFGLEVADWSDVFSGASYLRQLASVQQVLSPNRHLVGGQVGAYVRGPWDQVFEIFSDSDRLNEDHESMQWSEQELSRLSPRWSDGSIRELRSVLLK